MTTPVVVGFTGDPSGTDALALGLAYGRAVGAPVVVAVVHVDPTPLGAAKVDAEWIADRTEAAEALAASARVVLADLGADRNPAGVEVRLVAAPSASRGLAELAESTSAQAVVVGSSATGGIERHVFAGSTAARLLSGSASPVLVAPKGYAGSGAEIASVGVAYLETPEAEVALDVATRVAATAGASLTVLSAVPDDRNVVPWLVGRDGEVAYTAALREMHHKALDHAVRTVASRGGPTAQPRLLTGHVVEALADVDGVDLLIVGSRGYGPILRVLLGGVSSQLMRRSVNPVMVVPRGAE